jgi:hypothetical protein
VAYSVGPCCGAGQRGAPLRLALPKLGYIGEEIEGELPEAYYDVHASLELMWIMVGV